jgi:Tfp pilus assembly protein FimT
VSRDDDGFTLIDLLLVIVLVIVIVGIISVPLAAVVLGYLRGADATTARLAELRRSIEPTAATRAVTTGRCGEAELAERYDDLGIVLLTSNGR